MPLDAAPHPRTITSTLHYLKRGGSADDGRARRSFHTSFDNPPAPGAPPRESIEVRALVLFPLGR